MSVPLYMDHHIKAAVTDGLRKRDEWLTIGRDFAGVIYAHQLGITIGQAVRDLELLAKVLEPGDMKNRIEFLPYS